MKKYIFAAALLAASISGAKAADVVVQEPVAIYSWSGVYVGAQIGYAWGKSHFVDEDDDRIDYDPRGAFGGIYAGYNYEFANGVVLGVDADANFSGIERDAQLTFGGDSEPDPDHVANAKLRYTAAIRGRVGYAMDRFLPYIAGGVSFTELKFDLDHDGTGDWDFQNKKSFTGWNIGAGLDYAMTDNVILRAEYRYTDYGHKNFTMNWAGDSKINLKTNDIRLGIAYKF